MKDKLLVGGQAVIEGVMMKSPNKLATSVRRLDGSITTKQQRLKSIVYTNAFFKLPFIRGIVSLVETIVIGIKALNFSANIAIKDEEKKEAMERKKEKLEAKKMVAGGEMKKILMAKSKKELRKELRERKRREKREKKRKKEKKKLKSELNPWHMTLTIGLAILLAVGLFIVLPLYLTKLVTDSHGFWFNLIDGMLRIAIFLIYLGVITLLADVKTLFQYHGAEHKSIYCYEAGENLTVRNAKKYSCLHPRCGTTFILFVLVISILLFSIIVSPNFWVKFWVRIIFIPLIAGLSYELLRWGGKHHKNKIVRICISPGLGLQKMTTRKPNDKQIEVAIDALKRVI